MNENVKNIAREATKILGSDIHPTDLKSRIDVTPVNDVEWSGLRGQSFCKPQSVEVQELLAKHGEIGIQYSLKGEPDFSKVAVAKVRISDMTEDMGHDYNSAIKKLLDTDFAKNNNITTPGEMRSYMKEHELTIHEGADGVTEYLIERKIHQTFRHYGGRGKLRGFEDPDTDRFIQARMSQASVEANKAIIRGQESIENVIDEQQRILEESRLCEKTNETIDKTIDATRFASNSFMSGAKETLINSAIPLTSEAVRKMCKVASGEESFEDAAKDMAKTVVDVAVVGGTKKLVVDVINNQLNNSNNVLLNKLANSSSVSKLVGVAVIVNESAVKYINGEIDAQQFIDEVGEKGVNMVASMIAGSVGKEIGKIVGAAVGTIIIPGIGTAAGAVVGEILGTIITTVACSTLVSFYHTAMHFEDYKIQQKEFDLLVENANKEIRYQREVFKNIVEREYKHWDEEFDKGFQIIVDNLNDAEGVARGLDTILNVFGKKVAFKTVDEYKAQLNRTLVLSYTPQS